MYAIDQLHDVQARSRRLSQHLVRLVIGVSRSESTVSSFPSSAARGRNENHQVRTSPTRCVYAGSAAYPRGSCCENPWASRAPGWDYDCRCRGQGGETPRYGAQRPISDTKCVWRVSSDVFARKNSDARRNRPLYIALYNCTLSAGGPPDALRCPCGTAALLGHVWRACTLIGSRLPVPFRCLVSAAPGGAVSPPLRSLHERVARRTSCIITAADARHGGVSTRLTPAHFPHLPHSHLAAQARSGVDAPRRSLREAPIRCRAHPARAGSGNLPQGSGGSARPRLGATAERIACRGSDACGARELP